MSRGGNGGAGSGATPAPPSGEGGPPVVGITLRPDASLPEAPRHFQNRAYFSAIQAAGGVPLAISPTCDLTGLTVLLESCHALVLPGGPDVEPGLYGETVRDGCGVSVSSELDSAEGALLALAITRRLPVLAICRGAQLLNVHYGGTLWQDLAVDGATDRPHRTPGRKDIVHRLVLEPDSKLAALAGAGPLEANSLHHQGIRQLGKGLRPVARSEDGMVEAVEDPSLPFVLGLQCHPEELAHLAWTSRLFAALVAAAEAWREGAAAFSAAGDGPDYAEGL